jgi:hypothetical protein
LERQLKRNLVWKAASILLDFDKQLHLKIRCSDNYYRDVAHCRSNISERSRFFPDGAAPNCNQRVIYNHRLNMTLFIWPPMTVI